MKGSALVMEVAPGQYVFGTFPEYSMNQIHGGGIATVIDSFVFDEHQRRNSGPVPGTKAAERDNAIAEATGVRVPICEHKPGQRIQPPCLLFVTFEKPYDPRSIRRIDVGSHFRFAGRDVIINAVTIEFVGARPRATPPLPDLPWLRGAPNSLVATLPAGPALLFSHSIYVSDFRRP